MPSHIIANAPAHHYTTPAEYKKNAKSHESKGFLFHIEQNVYLYPLINNNSRQQNMPSS